MLENIVFNTIKKYNLIEKEDNIVIGVSGGADSIALLYFLNNLRSSLSLNLNVVHINHSMRGTESDEDEVFVKNICAYLNIPCESFKINLEEEAKKTKSSLEDAGRKIRYSYFNEVLKNKNANKIALAHNKNDNVETFLMRILRGSGLKGLGGINFKRDNIIRPLLECERKYIEIYCHENNLKYRNDSSNFKEIYTRNKIRLNLIPLLEKEFNANLIETISRTIYNFKEENEFLENLAQNLYIKSLIESTKNSLILNLNILENESLVIIKRMLRIALSNFNKQLLNISSNHINQILELIKFQSGKKINLPNKIIVSKEHTNLYISNIEENKISYSYELKINKKIYIKEISKFILCSKNSSININFSSKVCTIPLDYDKIKDNLLIREKRDGDKVLLNGINKKIKNLFIDLKIPLHKRGSFPILIYKNQIISILGICVSDLFKPTLSTKNILYIYLWEDTQCKKE